MYISIGADRNSCIGMEAISHFWEWNVWRQSKLSRLTVIANRLIFMAPTADMRAPSWKRHKKVRVTVISRAIAPCKSSHLRSTCRRNMYYMGRLIARENTVCYVMRNWAGKWFLMQYQNWFAFGRSETFIASQLQINHFTSKHKIGYRTKRYSFF